MIELTIIIITLVQKLTCQLILLNVTSLSYYNIYSFDDLLPQGFYLKKEEVILFSLLSLNNSENQPIMELCTDKFKDNCVIDHNAIDFQLSVQNVRIINQEHISTSQQTQYNAIPFSQYVYLEIRSNNSFNLIAQIIQYQYCPYNCKNGGHCSQGICICPKNYISDDCSIKAESILETQTLLNTQFYFFDIYQWMENEERIIQYFFARLEEEATIIMECYAQNPYLLQNSTEKQLQIINITVDQMNNCLNYVDELESNSKQQYAQIIIKLKQPIMVNLRNYDSTIDPLVVGIVVGSISFFILIAILFCVYRCKRDEEIQRKKNEEKQKMEKEKKIQEEKEKQIMPEFSYSEILQKFPGLKNDQECEICLNVFKMQERVRVTYCTHIFHKDCLTQWLNKHKTCPMCRENLNLNQLSLNHEFFSSEHQVQHITENQQAQYLLLRPKSQHNTRLYGDEHLNIIEQNSEQVHISNNHEENQNKQNQISQ